MASEAFDGGLPDDVDDDTNFGTSEQRLPRLDLAARQSVSTRQSALSSSIIRPVTTRSSISPPSAQLDESDRASALADSSSLASRYAAVVRKRKSPSPTSHYPVSSSSSARASVSPYSWLFDVSPHLFPATTVLASGTRPFEWLNTVDTTSPLTYLHSSHNIVHPSAKNEPPQFDDDEACCDCKESTQCMHGSCSCANPNNRPHDAMHTKEGLRAIGTRGEPQPGQTAWITECNKNCKCAKWRRKPCLNRVVQSAAVNPAHRLLVFHTGSRGWGALTLTPIAAWQYVCEYIGEVISDSLAESRTDKYLFSLDAVNITGGRWGLSSAFEPPTIDATQVGHIARFINHSCHPNCRVYQVMTENRDPLQFRFAFFSNQDIPAGVELTIDYAYTEEHKLRLFGGPCKCDACDKKEREEGEERKEGSASTEILVRGSASSKNGSSKRRQR